MVPNALRVHQFLPVSRANGPGTRAAIWTQGCSFGCPECFNPETHPPDGGESIAVDILFSRIAALGDTIEGISISGGEPLQQRYPLLVLLRRIRVETNLSVLVFTGYTLDEVRRMPKAEDLLACVDVLVAGRYDPTLRLAYGLRGSSNQTIHLLTQRYALEEVESVPPAEIIITEDGEITMSGIDPIVW